MKHINILGIYTRGLLHRFNAHSVYVESLTDDQVKKLKAQKENSGSITIKNKYGQLLTESNIFLFGKVDMKEEEDRNLIESFETKLWDYLSWNHIAYTNLNYETGDVNYDEIRQRYARCSLCNIIKWFKYNLVLIGNPKNVIVYKIPNHII